MNPLQASSFANNNPYIPTDEDQVNVFEKKQSEHKKAIQIDSSAIQDPVLKKALDSIKRVPLVRNPDIESIERISEENVEREIFTATQTILSLKPNEQSREKWIRRIACCLCPITASCQIVYCLFVSSCCCCRIYTEECSELNLQINPKTSICLRVFDPNYGFFPWYEKTEYLTPPERQEMNTAQQILTDIPRIRIAHAIKESLPIPGLLNIVVEYADTIENFGIPQNT